MQSTENLLTMLALDPKKESEASARESKENYQAVGAFINQERKEKKTESVGLIGGGIISLMTGFYLTELGFKVTIIEKQSLGAAASGRNGGAVMMLGRELLEIPFARHSINLWEQLSEKGIQTQFERKGHLMVAQNDIEKEILTEAFHLYEKAGIPVELMDYEAMLPYAARLNKEVKLGLFSPEDAQAYPFTTIQSLIKSIRDAGGLIYDQTAVTGFRTEADEIIALQTERGEMSFDHYILATGPWTKSLAEMLGERVEIKPRRSQLMVSEVFTERILEPFFTGNGFYSRQTPYGNILFGGGGPWEIDGFNMKNTNYGMELLSTRFTEMFPEHDKTNLIRAFAGTVEITPDHVPAFGPLLNYKNAFISAGYNGHGFGLSAVMGKLMSCMIYDQDAYKRNEALMKVLDPLSIKRFQV